MRKKEDKTMNSNTHSLAGLHYVYNGHVSTTKGKGWQGKGASRTLFCYPKIADIPSSLFACKVSQSPKPERQGKLVFKYLSFRFDPNGQFNDLAPSTVTMDTDLDNVKNIVTTQLASIPTAEISLQIRLHGKWKNITTGTGPVALYNDDDETLQHADLMKNGEPPYYIKKDAVITVTLKGMDSAQGNGFISSELSTTAPSAQVLQMRGTSAPIWDGTDGTSAPMPSPVTPNEASAETPNATPAGGSIW